MRLRPLAAVALLVLTALAAPASHDAAAADGRPRPVAQRSQPDAVAPMPAAESRAPESAEAAESDDADGALALLLAGLGAVGLMASRVRRPD